MGLRLDFIYSDFATERIGVPEGDHEFRAAFLAASSRVINELNLRAHASGTIVSALDEDTALDTWYLSALRAGLMYELNDTRWKTTTTTDLMGIYSMEVKKAWTEYFSNNAPAGPLGA